VKHILHSQTDIKGGTFGINGINTVALFCVKYAASLILVPTRATLEH